MSAAGLSRDEFVALARDHTVVPVWRVVLADQLIVRGNAVLIDHGMGVFSGYWHQSALAVHAEYAYCHTASLPVAVNFQCYAARRAHGRIYKDGSVELGGE